MLSWKYQYGTRQQNSLGYIQMLLLGGNSVSAGHVYVCAVFYMLEYKKPGECFCKAGKGEWQVTTCV